MWARRHRQQHAASLKGRSVALDPKTTARFSAEFEAALRQRGAAAKATANMQEAA
jgi:hypothetical protein